MASLVEDRVASYIEEHAEEALAELERYCRFESVAAQGRQIEETAAYVLDLLRDAGFEAHIEPKPAPGHPVVLAERRGASPRSLLFYNHYDVQPEDPLELWTSPPFEPRRADGKIYARGVSDNKVHLISRLLAVRAVLAVEGELPCTVKWLVEGDEEIGSPRFTEFAEQHRGFLRSDAALSECGYVGWDGTPQISLGVKGLLSVELRVRTAARDAHSSMATVVPNAAWRLVWALATIKAPDERILIPGWYDEVVPPTEAQKQLLLAQPSEAEQTLKSLELKEFLGGVRGYEYRERTTFAPTATINGLTSGYQGPGNKTVLPAVASAKLDFRLVPNQDPERQLARLREHLQRSGFDDIQVEVTGAEHPARTDPEEPFVELVRRTARVVYGREPYVSPNMAGTQPLYPLQQACQAPIASAGLGHPDARAHAPDENIRIADFVPATRHVAAIILGLAAMGD